MCLGQIGNLLPHVVVPAVMTAHLIPQWGLSNTEAGLLAAAYAAGYMVAVPVLSALTDRFDARQILFWGSLASASATVSFGLFANGYWAGLVFWCLAGMGFAGAYMPGLRALTDRLNPGDASRSVTYYTSSFSLGVGLSFLASQYLADALGWRWAFLLTGLGPLLMLVFAWRMQANPLRRLAVLCSIFGLSSGIDRPWGLLLPTAYIVSNFTASEPGLLRSGLLLSSNMLTVKGLKP